MSNSDANFSGSAGPVLEAAGRGIITDAHIDSGMAEVALALAHEGEVVQDIRLTAELRFNQLFNISQDASDHALHDDGAFGVATGVVEFNGPLNAALLEQELRWIVFGSGTWLTGPRTGMLGFNSFIELGVGLELVTHSFGGRVEGISLRLSGLAGDGVRGGSAGFSVEF